MARISEERLSLRAKARWREDKKCWQLNLQRKGERKSFYSKLADETNGRDDVARQAIEYYNRCKRIYKLTLETVFNQYIDYLKSTHEETTWYLPDSLGRTWVIPILGEKFIDEINLADIQDVLDSAANSRRAQKTLKHIRTETRKFFVWCYKRDLCDRIPETELLSISHGVRTPVKCILQPEEILQLFESETTYFNGEPAKDPLIHLYRYMLFTGLRPGEALALDASDIKEGGHKTVIDGALNDRGKLTNGKNKTYLRAIINCELAKNELLA